MNAISLHYIGFGLPLGIAVWYGPKAVRHVGAFGAIVWALLTVLAAAAPYIGPVGSYWGVVVDGGYIAFILAYYVGGNAFRYSTDFMPAGAVFSLLFWNMALADVRAALFLVPPDPHIVTGGKGLMDGLLVVPSFVTLLYVLVCGLLNAERAWLPGIRGYHKQSGRAFFFHHFCPWSKPVTGPPG